MRTAKLLIPILVPLAFAASSCKASVQADVNLSGKEEKDSESFDSAMEAPSAPPVLHTEYFGVARRLTLRPAQRPASCKCVAAVVGPGHHSEFEWHGDKPGVGPDALVIAISSDGIECEQKGRGPSIAAIDRQGQDVVIVLEEFKDTRPIALGAIIPNPGPGGSVYLRARGNAPYGRPEGTGFGRGNLCKVGEGTE